MSGGGKRHSRHQSRQRLSHHGGGPNSLPEPRRIRFLIFKLAIPPILASRLKPKSSATTARSPTAGPLPNYNFTATISNSSYTTSGVGVSPGDLVFTGTVNSGSGDVNYTILVPAANMSDSGIYGANPAWQILAPGGAPNPNKIVQKIICGLFCGSEFRFCRQHRQQRQPAQLYHRRFTLLDLVRQSARGQPSAKLPISAAFNAAQPQNSDRYNQFADYLVGVTDSYGFAYNDRLQLPLAALSDGVTLQVSILPDSGNTSTTNHAD